MHDLAAEDACSCDTADEVSQRKADRVLRLVVELTFCFTEMHVPFGLKQKRSGCLFHLEAM